MMRARNLKKSSRNKFEESAQDLRQNIEAKQKLNTYEKKKFRDPHEYPNENKYLNRGLQKELQPRRPQFQRKDSDDPQIYIEQIEKNKQKMQELLKRIKKSKLNMTEKFQIQDKFEQPKQFYLAQDKEENKVPLNIDKKQINLSLDHLLAKKESQKLLKPDVGDYRPQIFARKSKPKVKKLMCEICIKNLEEFKMVKLFKCYHLFCEPCISKYVQQKLKSFQIFNCPSCNSNYDQNSVFFLSLNANEQQKLVKINLRKQAQKDENIRLCPDEKCEEGIIRVNDRTQKSGKCEECNRNFCLSCMMRAHPGKCADVGASFLEREFNFKQCPKCFRMIERVKGCPHISCPCGKQFCYNCGQNWVDFGHICPQMKRQAEEEERKKRQRERERFENDRRARRYMEQKAQKQEKEKLKQRMFFQMQAERKKQKEKRQSSNKIKQVRVEKRKLTEFQKQIQSLQSIHYLGCTHFVFDKNPDSINVLENVSQGLRQNIENGCGRCFLGIMFIFFWILASTTLSVLFYVFLCFLCSINFIYEGIHSNLNKCGKVLITILLILAFPILLFISPFVKNRQVTCKIFADWFIRARVPNLQCL